MKTYNKKVHVPMVQKLFSHTHSLTHHE